MKEIRKSYTKTFYFDESEFDYIIIKWETGLKNILIYYNKTLVLEKEPIVNLKKGLIIDIAEAGSVFVKVNTNPLSFIVKAGDLYLKNSIIPEIKKVSATTKIINFIGVLCVISGIGEFLLDVFSFYGIRNFLQLLVYWQFYFGLFLVFSTYYIKKGYFFIFITTILIIASGILYVFSIFMDNNSSEPEDVALRLFFYGIGIFFLFFFFMNIKGVFVLQKNRIAWRMLKKSREDILDDY